MIQEAQRNPGSIKGKINIPGHIVIKLLETTENEKIRNQPQERRYIYIQENKYKNNC